MRYAIALFVVLIPTQSVALASFTDFTDYSETTIFVNGAVFQSGDLSFRASELATTLRPVRIIVSSGFNFLVPGSQGVEFLLPIGTQEVSISYSEGSGVGMLVNGVEPPFAIGEIPRFGQLDGMSAAGVTFETALTHSNSGGEGGVFTMRGPIDTLSFVGVELSFNEITVIVPEPTSTALFATACLLLGTAIRRRVKPFSRIASEVSW